MEVALQSTNGQCPSDIKLVTPVEQLQYICMCMANYAFVYTYVQLAVKYSHVIEM